MTREEQQKAVADEVWDREYETPPWIDSYVDALIRIGERRRRQQRKEAIMVGVVLAVVVNVFAAIAAAV